MIADASALLSVVFREPEHASVIRALAAAEFVGFGAPTLVEAGLVLAARLGPAGRVSLENLVADIRATTVPFGGDHFRAAVTAFERFGKGRHPARLYFGDCMSYATAQLAGRALLCRRGLPADRSDAGAAFVATTDASGGQSAQDACDSRCRPLIART